MPDYARTGNIATEEVTIVAGPLTQFQHTMEPELRKLGMHTSLRKGVVTLDTDYTICKKGDKLKPEQARLLVSFKFKHIHKMLILNILMLNFVFLKIEIV